MIELDHLILPVNDRAASVAFYTRILGFADDGRRGGFSLVRVSAGLTLQIAEWGTTGGYHLAFAMSAGEFESVFARVREAGVAFGDSFRSVGNGRGPGDEEGSRGPGKAIYFFDPNQHLIEIRHHQI